MNQGQIPPRPTVSIRELLSFSLAIVTIIGFVCTGVGFSPRTTAIVSIVGLVICGGLYVMFARNAAVRARLHSFPIGWPTLVIIALLCILIGTLLRQYHIDAITADVGGIAESLNWSLLLCQGKGSDACIAEKLAATKSNIGSKGQAAGELLYTDQALGEIVRRCPKAKDLVHAVYGVQDSFLGTGFSQPLKSTQFVDGRVPEYLVPNYPVTRQNVLIWKFQPETKFDQLKIADIVDNEPPLNSNGLGQDDWKKAIREHVGYGDTKPAVMRFAQLSSDPKCLGLPARHRVFVSHLGIAEDFGLTLGEAAKLSRYTVQLDTHNNLYLFVYIPSEEEEVEPPTWSFIVGDLTSQVGTSSLCEKAFHP